MDQYIETLRERFSSFTYRELQKEAKANSIPARQKKVELIEALVQQLSLNYNSGENSAASSPDPHNLNDATIAGDPVEAEGAAQNSENISTDSAKDLENISTDSAKDLENINTDAGSLATDASDQAENSNTDVADFTVDSYNQDLENINVDAASITTDASEKANSENIGTDVACFAMDTADQRSAKEGNRFAEVHSREFGKMPSILESRERLLQRHAQLTADIPAVFQKAQRPYQEFKQVAEMKVRFQFGEGLPCGVVKMSDTSSPQASSSSAKRVHTPRIDVKNMTMAKTPNATPSSTKTTPVWNGRISHVATPKGQRGTFSSDSSDEPHSPVHTPKSNRSYTPYKGSFRYMSDRDFVIYQQKMTSAKKEASNKAPNGEDGGGAGGSSNDDYSFDL
uniref:SAP domain-containing protein n=1 Tax=Globodera pallida TaxID=36090 RepID=A0A183BLH6_GLOPA